MIIFEKAFSSCQIEFFEKLLSSLVYSKYQVYLYFCILKTFLKSLDKMEGSFSISAFQSLKREKWSNKLLYHNLKKKIRQF